MEQFHKAYESGIDLECADSVIRPFLLWYFAHSLKSKHSWLNKCISNHHRRVLLAGIKNLGHFLCPLCLIHRDNVEKMGTVNDMKNREKKQCLYNDCIADCVQTARQWIFERGYSVGGKAVGRLLEHGSLVPTVI